MKGRDDRRHQRKGNVPDPHPVEMRFRVCFQVRFGLLRDMIEKVGLLQIHVAEVWCQHGIISFEDSWLPPGISPESKTRQEILIQDALALLGGMVSSRQTLVKDETPVGKHENKGKTIRTIDSLRNR